MINMILISKFGFGLCLPKEGAGIAFDENTNSY